MTVLLLFGLALFINISAASAADSTFNTTSIINSADTVTCYVEDNQAAPIEVTVDDQDVTSAQYLYLVTSSVKKVNSKDQTPTTLKSVSYPSSPTETFKSGSLSKTEYISIANKLTTFVNTNGRLPNYVTTSLGKIGYENLIYTYSKILVFYKTNNRLPNYVSVIPLTDTTTSETNTVTTTSTAAEGIVDQIMQSAAKFGYSGAAHDAAGLIKYGSGDCWAMSDYLFNKISTAGISVRIIQYNSGYTSNHRSVQVKDSNGTWIDVDYVGNGVNILFNAWPETNPKPAQTTIKTFIGSSY